MKINKKGFTLIELLVVIAIIGLLSTMAVVALSGARKKARDARRISDIKQVQTALDMYYSGHDGYPQEETWAAMSAALATEMPTVPTNPKPGGTEYTYDSSDVDAYTITFTLEGNAGTLSAGLCTATQDNISCSGS